MSQAFKEVVHSCLCREPAHRPTATQLMQFRFFRVRTMHQHQYELMTAQHTAVSSFGPWSLIPHMTVPYTTIMA